jgi:signal transduction histidine kinase
MEQMGGGLWFKSVVGEGTEFYIDIPLDQVLSEDVYRSRPDFGADLAA